MREFRLCTVSRLPPGDDLQIFRKIKTGDQTPECLWKLEVCVGKLIRGQKLVQPGLVLRGIKLLDSI